jgi:hypothetical protein
VALELGPGGNHLQALVRIVRTSPRHASMILRIDMGKSTGGPRAAKAGLELLRMHDSTGFEGRFAFVGPRESFCLIDEIPLETDDASLRRRLTRLTGEAIRAAELVRSAPAA